MSDPAGREGLLDEGLRLQQGGDLDAAERCYLEHLDRNPDDPYALHWLGLCAYQREQFTSAAELIARAVAAGGEKEASFHSNLGLALLKLGRLEEAVTALQRALELDPKLTAAHFNMGNACAGLERHEAAIEAYHRALEIEPDNGDVRWALANALLLVGRYREGWPAFEARRHAASLDEALLAKRLPPNVSLLSYAHYAKPRWNGEDLRGKTLLVHFEYGFGDTFQFVRYVPLLAARGAKVVLEVQEPLVALMRSLEGLHAVVARGEALPDHDLHCPLLSLPMYFDTTPETIPAQVPYLQADKSLVALWRRKLQRSDRLTVGLVWSGNPYPLSDGRKSMDLDQLAVLAGLQGVAFYGLQKRDSNTLPAALRGMDWTDLADFIEDFSDTAAILKNFDIMLTIDSGPAHLGGALGVPVWLMLPRTADWRWGLDEHCSWYPGMRLFRQPSAGDWPGVLTRVRGELQSAAEAKRAATDWRSRLRKWLPVP